MILWGNRLWLNGRDERGSCLVAQAPKDRYQKYIDAFILNIALASHSNPPQFTANSSFPYEQLAFTVTHP